MLAFFQSTELSAHLELVEKRHEHANNNITSTKTILSSFCYELCQSQTNN